MSRHALVAIRYSQARNVDRPANVCPRAPRAQERLLHRVLGLSNDAEHPVAVHVQLAAIGLGPRGERRLLVLCANRLPV